MLGTMGNEKDKQKGCNVTNLSSNIRELRKKEKEKWT